MAQVALLCTRSCLGKSEATTLPLETGPRLQIKVLSRISHPSVVPSYGDRDTHRGGAEYVPHHKLTQLNSLLVSISRMHKRDRRGLTVPRTTPT